MSRIFVTGDTHMNIDIKKLNTDNFFQQKKLTKEDYLIICGDFGLVWSNSDGEKYWRQWLHDKSFTTLFIDGNHENHELLSEYPVEYWNGGKVSFINDSIIHLKRGQIFNINGNKFFTMGGASSIDKHLRKEGISWWREELPNQEEIDEALDNLEKHNWKVDYILTHTTSSNMVELMGYKSENNILNSLFNMIERTAEYKDWYFGHFHDDKNFGKHHLVYNKIIELK